MTCDTSTLKINSKGVLIGTSKKEHFIILVEKTVNFKTDLDNTLVFLEKENLLKGYGNQILAWTLLP